MRTCGLFLLAIISIGACKQIDAGHRGIELHWGKIEGAPLGEGIHWYNPFSTDILELNVQEHKVEGDAISFTRDTQKVTIRFALTLYPDPNKIHEIFHKYSADWQEKLIPQAIQNSIKDVVGKYIADDLVEKRDEARTKAEAEIIAVLATRGVIATRLDFVNLDFDDAYEKAVEAKVVAIQRAAEAKNKTVEIDENAKQKVIAAKAEAESIRIRAEALAQNKGIVEMEAIQKWDGKLPQYMLSGGSVPFLNLDKK